ncbi:guanylin [Lepisosteus oculatus]|uniref:guanylin n=1 Tax=Lepisosteus oculatus TaxID=7918 RepID=UPI0007400A93|nr:PREDICTED: guanylin-like [Lepisosteus oculatus]
MRMFLVFILLASVMCTSQSVKVVDGDFSFSLESVMKLRDFMSDDSLTNPRLAQTSIAAICSNPVLLEEFQHVCQAQGASMIFSRLAKVATQPDMCEICANAACTGC